MLIDEYDHLARPFMEGHKKYQDELKDILGRYKTKNTKVIVGGIMRFRNLGINSRKLLTISLISLAVNAF